MKKMIMILMAMLLSILPAVPAMANHYEGADDWSVVFKEDKRLVCNFVDGEMSDILRGLQPGDDATFRVTIRNDYNENTIWYMENSIIHSMEDLSQNTGTQGGAYTYRLTYYDKNGNRQDLYDSEKVGGENISPAGEGLNEATNALDDYFYLDSFDKGQGGMVELYVGIDGLTLNNDYQDTLAELGVDFAVELESGETETKPPTPAVRTGDTNNLLLYYVIMAIAGVILAVTGILLIVSIRRKNRRDS